MKKKGWRGEKQRHKLASRGISTCNICNVRSIYEKNKMTKNTTNYEMWKDEVEKILFKHLHLGFMDLPVSFDWQDYFNDNFTPRQAVMMYFEEEAELPEVISSKEANRIYDILEKEDDEEYEKFKKIKEERGYGELIPYPDGLSEEFYFKDYPGTTVFLENSSELTEEQLKTFLQGAYIKCKKNYEKNKRWYQ
jgi:hypothetical protein